MFNDDILENPDSNNNKTTDLSDDSVLDPDVIEKDFIDGDEPCVGKEHPPAMGGSHKTETFNLDDLPDLEDVDINECGDFNVDSPLVG